VGVRSALIARWPSKIKANTVFNSIVEYTDLLPTFIEVAGGKPVSNLDGKSLLAAMRGQKQDHKDYAYSLQTTRGINNGSEHYGIRTVVNNQYRYILNLTPEASFKNNITEKETWWKEWEEVAKTDESAARLVKKYQYRPAHELYDVVADPYNMHNLADDPQQKETLKLLQSKLASWMSACGDTGQETEMEALQHMPKWLKSQRKQN
jgi:uncharacterized sulfatase